MSQPPLSVFLDAPTACDEDHPGETVKAVELRLQGVLGGVIGRIGREAAIGAAGIERETVAGMVAVANDTRSAPVANLTVAEAAALLAVDMSFPPDEVRGRIRDHLLVAMSGEPTDVGELSEIYGFADSETLRAKINGEKPLSLRDYARLRVAVDSANRNHRP